jgi:hypothetical protein
MVRFGIRHSDREGKRSQDRDVRKHEEAPDRDVRFKASAKGMSVPPTFKSRDAASGLDDFKFKKIPR